MALRDQPYLPLYIQDFLTDEKLIECSAQSTGVYIRLMCILHKSDDYGKILLKQKDKQSSEQIKNFALKLAKQMPYTIDCILDSLSELLNEDVIQIDEDCLIQKRMVKDNSISVSRSKSGKNGGEKTQKNNKEFASTFAKANIKANTENESEYKLSNTNIKESLINFFYIGIELYKFPVSDFIKTEFPQFLESWQMQNREIKIDEVLKIMDKECVGTTFGDLEHVKNKFKFTAKNISKPVNKFTPEVKTTASVPKPFDHGR